MNAVIETLKIAMLSCVDCSKLASLYMVHDDVWSGAMLREGVLCLACLEKRLGRRLRLVDFTEAPCNEAVRFGHGMGLVEK